MESIEMGRPRKFKRGDKVVFEGNNWSVTNGGQYRDHPVWKCGLYYRIKRGVGKQVRRACIRVDHLV